MVVLLLEEDEPPPPVLVLVLLMLPPIVLELVLLMPPSVGNVGTSGNGVKVSGKGINCCSCLLPMCRSAPPSRAALVDGSAVRTKHRTQPKAFAWWLFMTRRVRG